MPLILPENLPAIALLEKEHVFVNGAEVVQAIGICPLRIVVLNLMPLKESTETDLVRVLSGVKTPIELSFMKLRTHVSKHTSKEHIQQFYKDSDVLMQQSFDGMIVTGAPVEKLPYEAVDYWHELIGIFDWARLRVRSTLYLCWGAMAALYHFYNVPKYLLKKKKFGVFETDVLAPEESIFCGIPPFFMMPHSRHTTIRTEDIKKVKELKLLAESQEAGVSIVTSEAGRAFYVLGHLEYAADTLDTEYKRDLGRLPDVGLPEHYFPNDDPVLKPKATWQVAGRLFYENWVNNYVCKNHLVHEKP